MDLMNRQKPNMKRMEDQLNLYWKGVQEVSALVAKERDVPKYRDEALTRLVDLRKKTDQVRLQVLELVFEWTAHNANLMAVYTRYGEMLGKGSTDESLREFLIAYRDWMKRLDAQKTLIKDIYNECDYLLNAKLN